MSQGTSPPSCQPATPTQAGSRRRLWSFWRALAQERCLDAATRTSHFSVVLTALLPVLLQVAWPFFTSFILASVLSIVMNPVKEWLSLGSIGPD